MQQARGQLCLRPVLQGLALAGPGARSFSVASCRGPAPRNSAPAHPRPVRRRARLPLPGRTPMVASDLFACDAERMGPDRHGFAYVIDAIDQQIAGLRLAQIQLLAHMLEDQRGAGGGVDQEGEGPLAIDGDVGDQPAIVGNAIGCPPAGQPTREPSGLQSCRAAQMLHARPPEQTSASKCSPALCLQRLRQPAPGSGAVGTTTAPEGFRWRHGARGPYRGIRASLATNSRCKRPRPSAKVALQGGGRPRRRRARP